MQKYISTARAIQLTGLSRYNLIQLVKADRVRCHRLGTGNRTYCLADLLDYSDTIKTERIKELEKFIRNFMGYLFEQYQNDPEGWRVENFQQPSELVKTRIEEIAEYLDQLTKVK